MFAPEAEYERHATSRMSYFPAATHCCRRRQDQSLFSAADSSIALAHGSIRSLLSWLDANGHSEHSSDRRHK